MIGNPHEPADFNFGPPLKFEGQRIAENVFWPVVDELWHGNWRESSDPHKPLVFPKAGGYKGSTLSVVLQAEHSIQSAWVRVEVAGIDDGYESQSSFYEGRLTVTEQVPKESKDAVLNLVRAAYIETSAPIGFEDKEVVEDDHEDYEDEEEGFPDEEDDDDMELEVFQEHLDWLDGAQDELNIEQGTTYVFRTDKVSADMIRSVWSGNRRINVPAYSEELTMESFNVSEFSAVDLEKIEAGVYVLGASNVIGRAIQEIHKNPIY